MALLETESCTHYYSKSVVQIEIQIQIGSRSTLWTFLILILILILPTAVAIPIAQYEAQVGSYSLLIMEMYDEIDLLDRNANDST